MNERRRGGEERRRGEEKERRGEERRGEERRGGEGEGGGRRSVKTLSRFPPVNSTSQIIRFVSST
eukprot:755354-Hanusia_phi.AAC.3